MLQAAASQALSTKQMLVEKKEIIILLSTGTIESSLLKPFPEALRIQCAKQGRALQAGALSLIGQPWLSPFQLSSCKY